MIPVLSGRDQSVLEDIGYSTMLKSSTGQTFSVLWNHTLSIFKQCGNKELASEFIKYLALNPRTAERYYQATGMLPVSKKELESNPVYNDALGTVLKKQMETAHPIRVHDPSTFLLSVTICAKAAREILLGDADIAATLNSHAEIVKALQKK
jgi:maltose-binding protein MalE